MWKCNNCGHLSESVPENMKCSGCGMTLGRTKGTNRKYEILEDICRLNDYKLIIDACAGGGKVQLVEDGSIIDGSSLRIEKIAREKDPEPNRIYIEYVTKTYNLLRQLLGPTNSTLKNEDCNLNLLNFVDGKNPTLVYLDPFGYGIPAIKRDIILELSRTDNVDILISFSWRIAREMGHARRYLYCTHDSCPSPSGMASKYDSCNKCPTRKRATSFKDSLNTWWGNLDWLDWRTGLKDDEYTRRYADPLREHNKVRIFQIPRFGKTTYHLIFATKFDIPKYGIEKWFSKTSPSTYARGHTNNLKEEETVDSMKMNHLYYEVTAESKDIIKVTLDKPANVRVMDPHNYQKYRNGKKHRYHGGHVKKGPFQFRPPHQGHWYVVIDLGGYPGRVRASVNVLRGR